MTQPRSFRRTVFFILFALTVIAATTAMVALWMSVQDANAAYAAGRIVERDETFCIPLNAAGDVARVGLMAFFGLIISTAIVAPRPKTTTPAVPT